MKRGINVFEYASEITTAIKRGVLLTTKIDNKINSMTISWGTIGIEWGLPIFTVFVREGRFTRSQLDEVMEFTINIPVGDFDQKILGYCGTKSGKNVDKVKELDLTLVDSDKVEAPGIKEFPLTLECKVIYRQLQDRDAIPEEIKKINYPEDVDSSFYGANKDYHIAYYGNIVKAYIIE